MEILLIEDDNEAQQHVVSCLSAQARAVTIAETGETGLEHALKRDYAAIIVDRILPGMDGLNVVRTLRERGSQTPILILSNLGGINDRVEGLEAGADDYLGKPFAQAELIARINAMTRRLSKLTTRLVAGGLELDLIGRTVTRGDQTIDVNPQEFRLLEYLMRNAGQMVTRTMLLQHVWDLNFDPGTNVVETHLSRLRAKIDRDFGTKTIQTVYGGGYVFRTD
jgi:two-component system OmpR family response regulator